MAGAGYRGGAPIGTVAFEAEARTCDLVGLYPWVTNLIGHLLASTVLVREAE